MLRQQVALFETEGLEVLFTEDGIRRLAHIAYRLNTDVENIGARRVSGCFVVIVLCCHCDY